MLKEEKKEKDQGAFWSQISPVLERYGANGGPVEDGDKTEPEKTTPAWEYGVYYPVF